MFNVIKKWFDSVLKSYDKKQVNYLSGKKKSKEVKLVDLEYKTKKELEIIGRKIGIELDRRLTKDKLINELNIKLEIGIENNVNVIKPKRSFTHYRCPYPALETGELGMNNSDGKFYTKLSNGAVKELGGAGSVILQDVTFNGNITTNNIVLNGSDLVFEGYLANGCETTLRVVEATADNLIRLLTYLVM